MIIIILIIEIRYSLNNSHIYDMPSVLLDNEI